MRKRRSLGGAGGLAGCGAGIGILRLVVGGIIGRGCAAHWEFYIHDRYDLAMSPQHQRLVHGVGQAIAVTDWERERSTHRSHMRHSNPFVTGKRQWSLGHRNSKIV
jgi:hypothetical protein